VRDEVLITGISSHLGRLVARAALAHRYQVIGIDRRPWPDARRRSRCTPSTCRSARRGVFRTRRPDAVIHLATVTQLSRDPAEERSRINLTGTRVVFEHAEKYGVQAAIFVGRHTFYAPPRRALFHTETTRRSPSRRSGAGDLVAADLFAGSAFAMPQLRTVVLRICYTLAARTRAPRNFLGGRACRWCSASIALPGDARGGRRARHRADARFEAARTYNVAGHRPCRCRC